MSFFTILTSGFWGLSSLVFLGGSIVPNEAPLTQASHIVSESLVHEEVISILAECESGGNPEAINPHDGGSPSYGLLQFKTGTLLAYNKKYKVLPNLEDSEVMTVVMDPLVQRQLADKILSEPGGWRNWTNCLKNIYNK